MIKTSKNLMFGKSTKLRLDHETVRILGTQELIGVAGGISGGKSARACTDNTGSFDVGCCTL
jgi:hypothetical protein